LFVQKKLNLQLIKQKIMLRTKPTLLVLAAGMGSRYGGLKQIDKVGPSGETITEYSVFDAIRAGFEKVVFVIRKSIESDIREVFSKCSGHIEVDYVFQELENIPKGIKVPAERQKPWGTAHAVLVAADKIDTPFAVINADDFYGAETYKIVADHLCAKHESDKEIYCMAGYVLENTLSEYGYVSRGICGTSADNALETVVERTQIQRIDGKIMFKDTDESLQLLTGKEFVSMNFWGFPTGIFSHLENKFRSFIEVNSFNLKSEFYIPYAVNELIREEEAKVKVLKTTDQWFGITYKEDKENTIKKIRELIDQGVYPERLWK
jgi:UTP-glucose-1-phosphate uridylyltransferase